VTTELVAGRWWEPYLLPIFNRCCSPTTWTIEVGAYIGDHTIYLAQLGPVLAIEPQPEAYVLLEHNLLVRRTPHEWEVLRRLLYSDSSVLGWRADCVQPEHPSNGVIAGCSGVDEAAVAFDTLPQASRPIGFLKIDAQGCDLPILRGAVQTIQRNRPIILCEFEPGYAADHGDDADAYRGWFAQQKYTLRGFLGGNLIGVPAETEGAPYWAALTDQGLELTA